MRRYETILIAHVDLSEDELTSLIARYGAIVTAQKGILVKAERWGKRKLAYLIKKQARGFYILIDFAGESAVVNELERNLKIDDKILKFMTVLKAETCDPAALEKELADAANKEQAPPAAPQVITEAAAEAKTTPQATESLPEVPENGTQGEGEVKS